MKQSLQQKLTQLAARYDELGHLLSDAAVIADQDKFQQYSREFAQIEPVVTCFQRYQDTMSQQEEAQALLEGEDADMRAMAEDELAQLQPAAAALIDELQTYLLPKDPDDHRNVFLEIRAGTGGDEAALFAGNLFRMYSRYAESQRWQFTIVSASEGDHGGYKELIARVSGRDVYARLKFESGTHRVQRVPETESQGRIHTSACTVAVLPEIDEVEAIEIASSDLRVDTYRSSGAGGQHVNTTDSAVRITHIPTGVVVECQDERSQHKNRARAMSLLQAKILAHEREKQQREQAQTRRSLVGSGDRSERIRTYNFPQGRMTDHRINLTLYKLDDVLMGALDQIIEPLTREHQADLLAALQDD